MTTPMRERVFPSDEKFKLPLPFIFRRLHSLVGIGLAVYLFEHLLVNSQAALFFEDSGHGFISAVNKIHEMAYLKVAEILLIALPFLVHGIWGVLYLWTGKLNAHHYKGVRPELPQYKRNRAYSWQRITSWILLVGIIAHVVHMRFVEYPIKVLMGEHRLYMVRLNFDPGLPSVAEKLDSELYDRTQIQEKKQKFEAEEIKLDRAKKESTHDFQLLNRMGEGREWVDSAEKRPLNAKQVLVVAPSAGAAFFLIVRETFKSPLMVILYSILVITAAYHGFNGLWTFMVTWGVTLTRRSQKIMKGITTLLMYTVMCLGLISAWGTYWTILFQQ